jgi:hypothetical protein
MLLRTGGEPLAHEAVETRTALRRERALGLHASPELFVDPLGHVRHADGHPLLLRERVEGQEARPAAPLASLCARRG